MDTAGDSSKEATSGHLLNHYPLRRTNPNHRYASFLNLPDESLAAIFEHFAAPIVTGAVYRGACVYASVSAMRTLECLSLVNKRITKVALPFAWRHLCDRKYGTVYHQILALNRDSSQILALRQGSHRLSSSLQCVTSLSLDWRMDVSNSSARDDLVNAQIMDLCTQLRYLRLELRYSMPNIGDDDDEEGVPVCYSVLKLRLALLGLQFLRHLVLSFKLHYSDVYDKHSEEHSAQKYLIERHLAEITEVPLDSLQGLAIAGVTETLQLYNLRTGKTEEVVPDFGSAFNYKNLKMVRFVSEFPEDFIGSILDRLLEVASVQALEFRGAALHALPEVSSAVRSKITSLHLQGGGDVDPGLILSFSSLHALSCKVADVKHSSSMSHQELQSLTLTDQVENIIDWIKEYLPRADYLPNLRYLRIIVMWARNQADDSVSVLEVPESRGIAMEIEYEAPPIWAQKGK